MIITYAVYVYAMFHPTSMIFSRLCTLIFIHNLYPIIPTLLLIIFPPLFEYFVISLDGLPFVGSPAPLL